jgi:glycosyltransferase involved in cell wall biosynthesis
LTQDFRSALTGKRIAMVVTNGYPPDVRVAKEARALAGVGAEVVVHAWDRSAARPRVEAVDPGVTVKRFAIPSRDGLGVRQFPRFLQYWWTVARALSADRWDVIHAHDLDALVAVRLARRGAARVVYDAHELFPLMVGERLGAAGERAAWLLERSLVRFADVVITDGRARARAYHRALAIPRPVIVENTVDPAAFARIREQRQDLRAAAGIPTDAWVIGVFTGLNLAKRFDGLWAALARLPEVWVLVAGSGAGAAMVEDLARREPRVRFLGFQADLAPWYGAVDAIYYVLNPASRNSRLGFPNNVATAAVAGVPIITTDTGQCGALARRYGLGPVMRDAGAADIVGAVRELQRPERQDYYRERLARARPRFSWEASRTALLDAYVGLLAGTNRPISGWRGPG